MQSISTYMVVKILFRGSESKLTVQLGGLLFMLTAFSHKCTNAHERREWSALEYYSIAMSRTVYHNEVGARRLVNA
jgi:hypothetical protein